MHASFKYYMFGLRICFPNNYKKIGLFFEIIIFQYHPYSYNRLYENLNNNHQPDQVIHSRLGLCRINILHYRP